MGRYLKGRGRPIIKRRGRIVLFISAGDGRKYRRYLVPIENVIAAEKELKDGLPPGDWVSFQNIERISDS
jgi:hypothetical protein